MPYPLGVVALTDEDLSYTEGEDVSPDDPIYLLPTVISAPTYFPGPTSPAVPILIQPLTVTPQSVPQTLPELGVTVGAPARAGTPWWLWGGLLALGLAATRKGGGPKSWQ